MSELQVTTLDANNISALTVAAGNTTVVNNSGLYLNATSGVINTSAIIVSNAAGNVVIRNTTNVPYIFVGSSNVFPNSANIYGWASAGTPVNATIGTDDSIEKSPFGGTPFKIVPTAQDPAPGTYNSNTWNLATTANGDVWRISGYIRSSIDVSYTSNNQWLLVLAANSLGGYSHTINTPAISLTGNTWTKFDYVVTLADSANTVYLQISPDGGQSGNATFWYDGITIQKAIKSFVTETVNTQIFTANSTWVKPTWATGAGGNSLVIIHMWGGGGGGTSTTGIAATGGGGGSFVYGYLKASQLGATANVVVGVGGTAGANAANAVSGGDSSISISGTLFTAYGGAGAFGNTTADAAGGGGGWTSAGTISNLGTSGGPLGNTNSGDSTFGGGAGTNNSVSVVGGSSIYGGGGGSRGGANGGMSIYGGGGGSGGAGVGGVSVYGGAGGNSTVAAATPGGGGGAAQSDNKNGARGEVRVYTIRDLTV